MADVPLKGVRRSYFFCALMLLNTLAVFVLFNLGLFAIVRARDFLYPHDIPNSQKAVFLKDGQLFNPDGSPVNSGKRNLYQLGWFDFAAYDGNANYVDQVLTDWYELNKLGYIYQPWVQFSEPPFSGQRVHVDLDQRGFPVRRTINSPNDRHLPVIEVFALGGSTTFGYNVSDEHTWPSYISDVLNKNAEAEGLGIHVEVINYGRAYYTPSQETVLLIDLLKSGHRPSLVLFLDGVNPTRSPDVPEFTKKFSHDMRSMQFRRETPLLQSLELLPVIRIAKSIQQRWFKTTARSEPAKNIPEDSHLVDHIVNAFVQNRQISKTIADLYGINTHFFLQPNAFYNYPSALYRRPVPEDFMRVRRVAERFYPRLRDKAERIYLGDLFELWGHHRKAIVDDCHYSPNFNRFLAKHMAAYIPLKALRPPPALIDESAATGGPRLEVLDFRVY